jgi:hypothetical protein
MFFMRVSLPPVLLEISFELPTVVAIELLPVLLLLPLSVLIAFHISTPEYETGILVPFCE